MNEPTAVRTPADERYSEILREMSGDTTPEQRQSLLRELDVVVGVRLCEAENTLAEAVRTRLGVDPGWLRMYGTGWHSPEEHDAYVRSLLSSVEVAS